MALTSRNISSKENTTPVHLVGLDGEQVAMARIPQDKIGCLLTLDGRAFVYSMPRKLYLEIPVVVLSTIEPDSDVVLH